MRHSPVRLGPFELDAPIGRGGMGLVFRGRHTDQNVPVAVKVIEHSDGDVARIFRNEVRAMAGLDHPGVVWIFDVGEVPERVQAQTGGRIPAGAPYIAMEYASRGTLHDHIGSIGWDALRDVILQLLDALAHAHARGVVHRDLKPGNVLLCGPDDLRPGLKLADFGIAHAVEKTDAFSASGTSNAIGTLHYMSPEQIRSNMADYGPGTDLYALGHMVWHLLVGHVPFKGRHGMALVRAQLDLPLPELVGQKVPEGFMDWLRVCTAKDPADRFHYAADAARALAELGPAVATDDSVPESLSETLPTVRLARDDEGRVGVASFGSDEPGTAPIGTAPLEETLGDAGDRDRGLHTLSLEPPSNLGRSTSMPPTPLSGRRFPSWRRPKTPRRSLQLLGAGLELWGIRHPPMVGRHDERDALWAALRKVHDDGQSRCVLLTGPMGTGKSRLGSWVSERAHELAVGAPLRSGRSTPTEEGAADPIARMWTRWFRLGSDPTHKDLDTRATWVRTMLGRVGIDDVAPLAPLLIPGEAAQRPDLSADLLRAIGRDRPAVVFLDDVGPEGLRLVRRVLDRPDHKVLFVLTQGDEGLLQGDEGLLADREAREALEDLVETGAVEVLRVEALESEFRSSLVDEMLGLAPDLAAQVVERTEGNPLFAVQLLGDWVERGVLELGAAGFRLRGGKRAPMPQTMAQVWDDRVRQVLEGMPIRAGTLLERAAVLGTEVELLEWQQVCDDPDGSRARSAEVWVSRENDAIRAEIVEKLGRLRLVEPTASSFRFVHGMFREALLERARRERRWGSHHRACAAMLQAHAGREAVAERLGHHLLESGDVAGAIGPLLEGVERRTNTTGYRSALSLLARAETALCNLDLPLSDPTWASVWNLRSRLFAELGELEEAERWALRVLAHGDREGWAEPAVRSRLSLGLVHLSRGEWREADHEFARVLELSSDSVSTGWALAYRALLAGRAGDREKRKAFTSEAVRRLRRSANSRAMAACWRVVGVSCRMDGQMAQAEEALRRSLRLSIKMKHLYGQAEAHAELGEVARAQAQLADAAEQFRKAIQLYELTGSSRAMVPRVNLATVLLQQKQFEEAHRLLSRVRLHVTRQGRELAVQALPALLMAAAAGRGEWEDFDHHLRQAEVQRREGSLPDDAAEPVRWAATMAKKAGQRARSSRAEALLGRKPTGRTA